MVVLSMLLAAFGLQAEEDRLPTEIEVEATVLRVWPKYRFRDGETGFRGTNVRSGDLEADHHEWGGAGQVAVRLHQELLHAQAWAFQSTGSGRLVEDTTWGG